MVAGNSNDQLLEAAVPLQERQRSADDIVIINPARAQMRPMRREDVDAVAALFRLAFDKGQPSDDLPAYIETVFLECPDYSEKHGSLVYEDSQKAITAALLSLPMPFIVHDRPVTARLLCAFMSDGTRSGAIGAARITRSLGSKNNEFCFTDNASPVSAAHWAAGGGFTLPVQSLEWRRAFQPVGGLFSGIGRARRTGHLPRAAAPFLRLIDHLVLVCKPALRPQPVPDCISEQATLKAFSEHAEEMTQRFAVRPAWGKAYFEWLLRIAAMNRTLGSLHCRTIVKSGRIIGVYLYVGKPGTTARVLNILCDKGCEFDVVAQMFASLASEGYVDAAGMAQPFIMEALMRQRRLSFQHRGYFCVQSCHGDLITAARAGDLYIGGVASESWSRLVTDF